MMTDFIKVVKNILEERGKSTDDLFCDKIISKDTFYKYKQRNPSLKTIIKIANYLEVSIDYMYELSDRNKFMRYSSDQKGFYDVLINLIKSAGISIRQFCKDLNYSKDNVLRYRKGVEPSLRTLFEIADYFDCSIDDLLIHEKEHEKN